MGRRVVKKIFLAHCSCGWHFLSGLTRVQEVSNWNDKNRADKLVQRGKVNGITFIYYGREETRGLFNQCALVRVCEELRGEWWWPAVLQHRGGLNGDKWLRRQPGVFGAGRHVQAARTGRYFTPVTRSPQSWKGRLDAGGEHCGQGGGRQPCGLVPCDWRHSVSVFWAPRSLSRFLSLNNLPFSSTCLWESWDKFLLSFVHLNDYLGNRLDFCHLKDNHSTNRIYLMSGRLLNVCAFLLSNLEHGKVYYPINKNRWRLVEWRILHA